MDITKSLNTRPGVTVFAAAFLLALAWALATNHVWEDYYITYRSSKNLATGHGLVFNQGERLHTFTSPLGVLLPAAAIELTGHASDEAALWLFRLWSCAAFAGAAVLLCVVARRYQYGGWAAAALVGFAVLDAKSIDFSTNGMETGFLLLFITYTLWAMLVCRRWRWQHLGVAWAGLMWTRPDSFLYVGLLAAGVFLFNDPERTGLTRWQWLGLFLRAGALCTVLYLPWLVWAWWYYGTPVPHTITAKGGVSFEDKKSTLGVLKTLLDFPWTVWSGSTSLEATFLPSYFQIGGWPAGVVTAARAVAVFLAFQWVLPLWRTEVRVASFAFCGLHVYLTYFPFFPFPWYLPGPALLAAVALGGMVAQLLAAAERRAAAPGGPGWSRGFKVTLLAVVLGGLGAQGWVTYQMEREMTLEQIYSATGVRRRVGEWLKANAKPTDTVFMEPLGHIGYFSGLKTYDYPGLSSMDMVEAIRALGTDWASLVEYLSPDWLVLRPFEFNSMHTSNHRLFDEGSAYKLVKEFNNLPQIELLKVYGRKYIEFDAHLLVFQRQVPRRYKLDPTVQGPLENVGLPIANINDRRMYMVHAKGTISFQVPVWAKHFRIPFVMPEGTYRGTQVTDGVEFSVLWTEGGKAETLALRYLDPVLTPGDRGMQFFDLSLPKHGSRAVIILRTLPGPTDGMDWSHWGSPEFQ